jgi:CheY-like chemotaxis protein
MEERRSARDAGKETPMATDITHKTRVLVVEDDLASRILVAVLLENAGYAPTAVATIARALERLEDEGTDLVLTDLNLIGESGLDLLRVLRSRHGSPPAIAMTGSDDPRLIAQAFELGARTVLRKPYTAEWLYAAVGSALDQRIAV